MTDRWGVIAGRTCPQCFKPWHRCLCDARLDAGELAYVERLLTVGFAAVYAAEVREFNARRAAERGAA